MNHFKATERSRRRFFTITNLQTLILFVAFLVLVLGAIGGAQSMLEQLVSTRSGVVVLVVIVLGALTYALLFRRDLRLIAATQTAGELPETTHAGPLVSEDQCEQIHRLASTEFGLDAMPLNQVQSLHWALRDDVALAFSNGEVTGYFAVLAPTPALVKRMLEAPVDPTHFVASDFLSTPSRWTEGSIYIESVVRSGTKDVFPLLADYIIRPITKALHTPDGPSTVFVCGFGSTPQGQRLLERTLRLPVHFSADQTEWAPFYAGRVSVQNIVSLARQLAKTAGRAIQRG